MWLLFLNQLWSSIYVEGGGLISWLWRAENLNKSAKNQIWNTFLKIGKTELSESKSKLSVSSRVQISKTGLGLQISKTETSGLQHRNFQFSTCVHFKKSLVSSFGLQTRSSIYIYFNRLDEGYTLEPSNYELIFIFFHF